LRPFKLILISLGGLLFFFIVSAAIYVTTLDDDDYRRLVTWAVERYTDYKVIFKGSFSVDLSTEPSLSASEIYFENDSDGTHPSITYIGRFKIRVALASLISGTIDIKEVFADDVRMSVRFGGDLETRHHRRPSVEAPSKIVIPIIESIILQNVTAELKDRRTGNKTDLYLRLLTVDDIRDTGPMYVKAEGAVYTFDFKLNGRLGAVADLFDAVNPYPIDLELNLADLLLSVSGTVDDPMHGKGLNLHVAAQADETANLVRIFKTDFPNLGQLTLNAHITGDASSPGLAGMELAVSGASDFKIAAKGSIGNLLTGDKTSLHVSGSLADKDILDMLLPEGLPEIHMLNGNGLIRDGDGVYVVEVLKLNASNKQGTSLKAEGTMGFNRVIGKVPKFTELDLSCRLSSPTTESVKFSALDFLPELGAISAKGRVLLSDDLLSLEDLAVNSSHPQGLQVKTAGTVRFTLNKAGNTPVQMDLQARVTAPDMGAAKPLTGKQYLSGTGPLLCKGRIIGSSKVLSIEDILITLGKSGPVRGRGRGRIGNIPLSNDQLPSDVEIFGSIEADEASTLASIAGIGLPDIGPLKTTFRLVEQGGTYGLNNIRLSIGSQGSLWLKGTGSVDLVVMKDGAISLSGVDTEVEAWAPNLAAIPKAADWDLPDLRPLNLKARIIDRDGHPDILDIEKFKFDAGTRGNDFLTIDGQVSGLHGSDKRRVKWRFKTNSKPWVMKMLKGSAPENYDVEGKLHISGTLKNMRIEKFQLLTPGKKGKKRLFVEAQGNIKKTGNAYEFQAQMASDASDTSIIQSFLGIKLPRFGAPLLKGQITGNMTKASFKGDIRLGNSWFATTLSHSLTQKRPRVMAKIVAPTVYLTDLGLYPERPEDLAIGTTSGPQPDNRWFANRPLPLNLLKAMDLSVSVDIDKIMGHDFALQELDFDMSLEDGKLRIAPAKIGYENGSASIDFTIDTLGPKSETALKVTAEDVDIGALLAHIHESPFLKGQLNLVVDLKSTGNTPREIAAALDGEVGVAIEKGKIGRVVEVMGADAIDLLDVIRTKTQYKDLNCMAVRFFFEKGLGKSKMIYIDTPTMFIRGAGEMDLHTQTMKIVLQPKPKKGIWGTTSPVTIKGPIVDPHVRKLPFREAAKLYGEIAMPMVFLPARAMGYLWYLIKKDTPEDSPCLHLILQDK